MNTNIESCNLKNICRICLIQKDALNSIFAFEKISDETYTISEILMICAEVMISKEDSLPENICHSCINQLKNAFLFKKLCEKSDKILRQLHLIKEEDVEINIKDEKVTFQDIHIDSIKNDSTETDPEVHKIEEKKDADQGDREICNEEFEGLRLYSKHMINAHEQKFKCKICDKLFSSQKFFEMHMSIIHDDDETVVNEHKSTTDSNKIRNLQTTCEVCNKKFRFHSYLERHKLIHTGEKPFLCNVCGKGFTQLSYLKIHFYKHTGEKPYQCQMCEKSFAAPSTLMIHVRTHTGERPHICKICGKDFSQPGKLAAHIRMHTGERPNECSICNKKFNQTGRLIVHMRVHSGERPYQCKECDKSFADQGTLKIHIRTHTGERPYKCNVCAQSFSQNSTLKTHMKVHKSKETT